jgi:hypothetical protein
MSKQESSLADAVGVAADVLEEAAGLVRQSLVREPGEWAIQICGFGFVLVGKWHDEGGGIIGCKPGEAWIYTRQRGGDGFGGRAAAGPSSECRLDIIPSGVRMYAPAGLPRLACDAAKWEAWRVA